MASQNECENSAILLRNRGKTANLKWKCTLSISPLQWDGRYIKHKNCGKGILKHYWKYKIDLDSIQPYFIFESVFWFNKNFVR